MSTHLADLSCWRPLASDVFGATTGPDRMAHESEDEPARSPALGRESIGSRIEEGARLLAEAYGE